MRVVVIGGTGMIGRSPSKSRVRPATRRSRHRRTRASTRSPARACRRRSRAPRSSSTWRTPQRGRPGGDRLLQDVVAHLLAAEAAAGVKHHLALSVVGADRLSESGYMGAKVAQEDTVKASPVPYTILRASQFFEFTGRIADSSSDGDSVRLAPVFVQPESANDVAAALAALAVSEPVNGIVELVGPNSSARRDRPRRSTIRVL